MPLPNPPTMYKVQRKDFEVMGLLALIPLSEFQFYMFFAVWHCHSGVAADHCQRVVLQELLSFGVGISASQRTTANMLSYSMCCHLAPSFRRLCGPPPTCSLTVIVVVWRCHAGVAAEDRQHLVVQHLFSFWGGPKTNEFIPFSGSRSEVLRIRPPWSEFVQSEFVHIEYTRGLTLNIRAG